MNKKRNIFDIVIAVLVFMLFLIPLAIPFSYFPLSKFYSEVAALFLALLIGTLMILKSNRVSISSVGIGAILFALFLILQIVLVDIRFPGINLAISCEFIVATIMSIGVVSYIDGHDNMHKKLAIIIAWAVLISTTLQAFYGLLQFTGAASNFQSIILYTKSGFDGVFGNIGQKNDYADFIFLGVFALAYLYFIEQINIFVFTLYEAFFLSIVTVCTSRTALLYLAVALIVNFIYIKAQKNTNKNSRESRRVFKILLILFAGFIILQISLPPLWNHFAAHAPTTNISSDAPTSLSLPKGEITSGLYRFKARDIVSQTTTRRVYEWYKDIIIFTHNPLFGIGWYQYPRAAIYLMETPRFMYITANTALYTHSHNSPLNVLAETGIIGFFLTFIYGFAYSLYRMFKKFNNIETLFLVFMILTTFTQGLFQYPLWYSYFLLYFILFLSFDKPIYSLKNNKYIKIGIICVLVLFSYMFKTSLYTYTDLVFYTDVPQDSDDFTANVIKLEGLVNNNLLWSLPALMVLDNYILPGVPQTNNAMPIADQMKYTDMLASELPYSGAIFKQIILHKENSDEIGASRYAHLLAYAYPAWKDKMADNLATNPQFESQINILRGFKYQEHTIFKELFGEGN